jgi:hypothetical protein
MLPPGAYRPADGEAEVGDLGDCHGIRDQQPVHCQKLTRPGMGFLLAQDVTVQCHCQVKYERSAADPETEVFSSDPDLVLALDSDLTLIG